MSESISRLLSALSLSSLVSGVPEHAAELMESSTQPQKDSMGAKKLLFDVRETPGRGLGMFATEPIATGTRLLAESPLLVIPYGHYFMADIEKAFFELPEAKQESFMSLASAHGQSPKLYPSRIHPNVPRKEQQRIQEQHDARTGPSKTIFSVFMTNAMQWGARGEGAAVFATASRINHSCVPNAHFAWNQNIDDGKGMETVHATRDIASGEEITLTYCDPLYDVAMRKWELQHYGFKCDCKACIELDENGAMDPTCFAAASAERRYRLRELDELLGGTRFGVTFGLDTAVGDAGRLTYLLESASLMVDEGLMTPSLGQT